MKQSITTTRLAVLGLLTIGGVWLADQRWPVEGAVVEAAEEAFMAAVVVVADSMAAHTGGGGGNFHAGGNPGNFGGGGAGVHSGGNFNAGGFSGGNFSRPTQGHVPSFSSPGQFNAGGQTFSHPGNSQFNPLNSQTNIHNPTNNNLSGATVNNRVDLGNRPTAIGNHTNNFSPNNFNNFNNNNFVHGGNTNINNVHNNPVVVNKPVIGGNTNVNNFSNHNFNNQNFNNQNFNNHNFNNGSFANQNSWYHGHWHNNWNNNNQWYNRPTTWWGGGYGLGFGYGGYGGGYGGYGGYGMASVPWSWGYYNNYSNPYYTQPVGGYAGFNYSQPIVMAQGPAVANVAANDPNQQQPGPNDIASQALGTAREAFMRGDYPTALTQTDLAVAQMPNDPVIHEFRGLVLFAMQRYQEAAAAEYGVLSVGPGWDWTTLISLYPDSDTYTGQLRALEQYTSQNPRQPEARFLLAYHYLTCGHTQDAQAELQAAVQLNPKDQLSTQLLASLTAPQNPGQPGGQGPGGQGPGGQPGPAQPTPPAEPVNPTALVGDWQSSRPDGSSFALKISNDNTFTWKFTQQGKTQSFNGPYTLENNALTLKQGETPAMAGIVTPLGENKFNFKVGDNPADPGLTFTR